MKLGRALLLLAFALAPATSVRALDPAKALTQYGLDVFKEGLPQFSIHAIAQTKDGYLWVGTQQGLGRFNGSAFTVFNTRNTQALRGNVIWSLLAARDGSLWVGMAPGGVARYRDGHFVPWGANEGLPGALVTALLEDAQGRIWIATSDGLSRFDGQHIESAPMPSHLSVRALASDASGALWIGTETDGLYRLKGQDLTHWTAKDGLGSDRVRALAVDAKGRVFIGSDGGGLVMLEAGTLRRLAPPDGAGNDLIRALVSDRDGSLFVGTFGGGLSRWRDGRMERLTSAEGLSSDIVFALLEDRDGSLWIGSVGGGLDRLKDGSVAAYSRRQGLPDNLVRAIVDDTAGHVWVATNRGLARLEAGAFKTLTSRDGLPHDAVYALWPARDGSLWAGTRNGLARVRDGRVVERLEMTKDDPLRALFEARDGALWIGTEARLLRRAGAAIEDLTELVGLAGRPVYAIGQDQAGDILVGTEGGGLVRIHEGKEVTRYTAREGLPSDVVRCANDDGAGNLWVCTDGGLALYRDAHFTAFGARHGLPDDVIHEAVDDGAGNLWLATNRGIDRVTKAALVAIARHEANAALVLHVDTADGMLTSECNGDFQPAGWRARDGRLYFPTVQGLVALDPTRTGRVEGPPPAIIEALLAGDVSIPVQASVRLPPGTRRLELRYAGVELLAPARLRFRYRLAGLDDDWTDAGRRREAYYTNVPAGRYRFEVEVGSPDGRFGPAATLPIEIEARFSERRWFPYLAGLLLFLLGAAARGLWPRRSAARP